MITIEDFQAAVTSLLQLLPMQRALDPSALLLAWDTFPEKAKQELTDEILLFAVQQRVLDPDPPKGVAPHVALLRYAYPIDRTIKRERGEEVAHDYALVERGLRSDLAERMAAPDRFHDPAPARQEQAPPQQPRLPAGATQWHPDHLTPEQRRAHVQRVARAVARICKQGGDQRAWSIGQLKQGRWWFEKALQGFWSMECDDGGLAAAWIIRNERWAQQLIEAALEGTTAEPAEAVVAGFAGGR